jgi:large subunit ribosomal protein L10
MLTKEKKQKLVDSISDEVSKINGLILLNFKGLDFEKSNNLRKMMKKQNNRYRIVKNRLLKIALEKNNIGQLNELLLEETGTIFVYNDFGQVAKDIKQLIKTKEYENLKIKGAYFDGRLLSASELLQLADLPSREVLISKMLASLKAPVTNVAYLFNNILLNFINVLNAINEKKSK